MSKVVKKTKRSDEPHVVSVARKVFESRGDNFNTWAESIVATRQLELLQGTDENWKAKILEEECQKLVVLEVEDRFI